jgi:DNA-binding MarR family transcriptional regulator
VTGASVVPERENRLSALELRLLTAIRRDDAPPSAQARLAEGVGGDKGDVSRALRELSYRGLIVPASRPEGAAANSKWWLSAGDAAEGDE